MTPNERFNHAQTLIQRARKGNQAAISSIQQIKYGAETLQEPRSIRAHTMLHAAHEAMVAQAQLPPPPPPPPAKDRDRDRRAPRARVGYEGEHNGFGGYDQHQFVASLHYYGDGGRAEDTNHAPLNAPNAMVARHILRNYLRDQIIDYPAHDFEAVLWLDRRPIASWHGHRDHDGQRWEIRETDAYGHAWSGD